MYNYYMFFDYFDCFPPVISDLSLSEWVPRPALVHGLPSIGKLSWKTFELKIWTMVSEVACTHPEVG